MKIAVVFQQRDIPNLRAEREIRTLTQAGFDTARISFATPRFSPIGNLARRAVEFEGHVRQVANAISKSGPDLIIAHDLEALPSAVRTGKKTVYDSHDDWPAVYADNSRLDKEGFVPIGKVIEGMQVVDQLYAGYGETAGGGMRGGKQGKIFEDGNAYLDREFPKLDKLRRARVSSQYRP